MSCNHECGSCSSSCGTPESLIKPAHKLSNIKRVIGVVSGKGGVGKSLTTCMLATNLAKQGKKVAILDADITGPSIPRAFGLKGKLLMDERGVVPVRTDKYDIAVASINLVLEHEDDPVIYRGPIIAQTVQQFWQDVVYDDVDYMFVDMPPGTGDVPLTVFQSIPLDGIIIMTSPQSLVSMVVGKAVKMAKKMNIPIIGIIENYSYIECEDCGKKISVFGESQIEKVAQQYEIPVLCKLPIDPKLALAVDNGDIENAKLPEALDGAVSAILAKDKE